LGISGKVERATVEQVKDRLEWLKMRKAEMDKQRGEDFTLSKRIAERRRLEEEEKQRKRDKKKEKRRLRRQREEEEGI
jgi:U4/U6.U5 tri-snRNP component SNU23